LPRLAIIVEGVGALPRRLLLAGRDSRKCNGNPQSRPATGQQKIDALRNWIAVNGPLEKLAGWRMIDVRSGQVLLVPETRTSFRPEVGKRPY